MTSGHSPATTSPTPPWPRRARPASSGPSARCRCCARSASGSRRSAPSRAIRIAACMHVTTETANLMRALQAGGAELALCASNPLSTQDDTAAALVHEYGVSVFAHHGTDVEGYYRDINAALRRRPHLVVRRRLRPGQHAAHDAQELLDGVLGGCEETTTGVIRLRAMAADKALRFPMVAVNDTDTKHMFDNRYGTGQSTLDAIFRATNTLLAGKKFVVAGYGYCGKGVADAREGDGRGRHRHRGRPDQGAGRDDAGLPGAADVRGSARGRRVRHRHRQPRRAAARALPGDEGRRDPRQLRPLRHRDRREVAGAQAVTVNRKIRHQTDEYVLADGRRSCCSRRAGW